MQLHELQCFLDRLLLRFELQNGEATDDLFRLGERPVGRDELPPVNRTLAPFDVCCRPPIETIFPAFAASSPSLSIAFINSMGGGPEAAKFSSPFTIIK